jgi:hypothetical protein
MPVAKSDALCLVKNTPELHSHDMKSASPLWSWTDRFPDCRGGTAFPNAYDVKALSPHHRFAIALHSLMESLKPDCACVLQRKAPENLPADFDRTLSPVRFEGKTCGIAAILSDSCSKAARFLCNPDCVAERSRFEPSLPFVSGR